jgi:protein gp37
MGKDSKISWTTHTFNPWWGCVEVSPACDNCYAREVAARYSPGLWGKNAPRKFFPDKHWNDPVRWNKAAKKAGERHRVFCASMADVCEDRDDLNPQRERLWKLIEATPDLDWMLLTKRPENYRKMLPAHWVIGEKPARPNVWLGTTAENQRRADERIPHLVSVPAVVYWISAEPLLGPIDFSRHWSREVETGQLTSAFVHGIDWIIVGGESGNAPRRMDPQWARDIRRQCEENGAAYHFKQKGRVLSAEMGCKDREGKKLEEWPTEFQIQEFPKPVMV